MSILGGSSFVVSNSQFTHQDITIDDIFYPLKYFTYLIILYCYIYIPNLKHLKIVHGSLSTFKYIYPFNKEYCQFSRNILLEVQYSV